MARTMRGEISDWGKKVSSKHKKGTADWLKAFLGIVQDYGLNALRLLHLTPLDYEILIQAINKLRYHDGHIETITENVALFLGEYGFNVEPKGIGYLIKEATHDCRQNYPLFRRRPK
jgi:hypothetical protein